VRYEQIDWNSRAQVSPPTFKLWQPRLGLAYDIFNNATSVVHGYAGRIMDDNQLTLPSYGVSEPTGSAFFNLDPKTGKYVYDARRSSVFATGELYDANLKPSYSNQYSLGFTQKIWRNTSVDLTYERRNQKDLFEDYCGTFDAPLDNCVVTNHPGFDVPGVPSNVLRAGYHGLITKIESRPYNWLDLVASWTHSQSKGSYGSSFGETQNASALFDFYPVFFHNTYGYLSDDAKNRVKVDGYVRLPLDFTVGANYYWDSGVPYDVFQSSSNTAVTGVVLPYGSYFVEPRGSRRLPAFSQLDLQVQKDFRVGPTKLGLIAAVYNVFNTETITGVNGNAGSRAIADPSTGRLFVGSGTVKDANGNDVPYQLAGPNRISPTFGLGTAFQTPRRYEAGIRVEF
jgi:hypothetical protein